MFVLSALVYPAVLVVLGAGAGLAVDRASGGWLPGVLLPAVGLAALICAAQLSTYLPASAPGTGYVLAVLGAAGLVSGWPRVREVVRHWRAHSWQFVVAAVVFLVCAAPVLFAGRATFSGYMVLTDSAFHMMGADYLVRHGQAYAHLDLVNSYGQYIKNYYGTNYPTGADALLGGSARLIGVPVIWAFQPFNAVVLALAGGPAWLLARRMGLQGIWAASAAIVSSVPALVYAYELIGSVKEIVALPLILCSGALVVVHPRWLSRGPRAAIPFALVVAGGVSALGVAFGAWAAVAVAVLAVVAAKEVAAGSVRLARLVLSAGAGVVVLFVGAWPTWHDLSGSFQAAQAIATTANTGNLTRSLKPIQVFGTWLTGTYAYPPTGASLALTDVLIGVTGLAAVVGTLYLVRSRRRALAGWCALTTALALVLILREGVWAEAKTLMLTSPVALLLAWGAVAALLRHRRSHAVLLALILAGGVLASDVLQYHYTDLAPTARYGELARINSRFAGHGPALFTDFDEYALYELRGLDIGGPDFLFRPLGLRGVNSGHGGIVDLTRTRAGALRRYPLIVTRRDPIAVRPPSAYRLVWQGTYYQVWRRRPHAPAAIGRYRLTGTRAAACSRVRAIAAFAGAHNATIVAASPADIVRIKLAAARRPRAWARAGIWYAMRGPGQLETSFAVPRAGVWNVWLQGEIMRRVTVGIDGHVIGAISGQVAGDEVVPDTTTPLPVRLTTRRHRLTIALTPGGLGPGAGGSADLSSIFVAPAGTGEQQRLTRVAPPGWRSLCGHRYVWIEAVPR